MKDIFRPNAMEDDPKPNQSLSLRINIFFFSTFIIFCIIIVRLAIIQFVEGSTLTEAEASRDTKNVPLASIRGTIFAKGGEKLAYSTPVQTLYFSLTAEYAQTATDKDTGITARTPEAVAKADTLAAALAADFAKYGAKVPEDQVLTKAAILKAMDLDSKVYSGFMPRPVKRGMSNEEIAYFMENKDKYPNLTVSEEDERHYDPDTVAVQTVGYIKPFKKSKESFDMYLNIQAAMRNDADPGLAYRDDEFVGFDGLELQYQRELRGRNGYLSVAVNAKNMAEGIVETVPPVKGNNLWTTIDKTIQMKTEQAILDQIKWVHSNPVQGKVHPDAKTGYAVAMEVDTGNVVAMASMEDYDTNLWTTGTMPADVWNELKQNYQNGAVTPISSGRSGHNFDSAVLLGSVIKPLTVLIGLNEGFITTSTSYTDKGSTTFGRAGYETTVRNSGGHAYGYFKSPAVAIEKSSNVFMIDMVGKKLYEKYGSKGVDVWDKYMKEFGLGEPPESGLPKEHRGVINYFKEAENGSPQSALVYASFGQQGRYTVLQLAQYASTLANRGVRIKPQLVSKITDPAGNTVKAFGREVLSEVTFNNAYWNEIIKGMNTSVTAFEDFPYDFARKTGTSQQEYYENKSSHLADNGVFIAFAPRDKPKLAVAVVIPEGGFGSNSAAPVARKIFDAYDWEYGLDGIPKKSLPQPESTADGAAAADGAETDPEQED
ncbi:peptidoglycan D,D-transpeptidase FtsI family protein [Paenibacillus typhae]|uniref:Peptidoglycan glycosyltransferase /cell elongation-specific peptidoglycan D,D-transpeptidase n=1 Tax=Paenibacillus typhae TaxID=1174501 RepID=A0A1G8VHU0_9BACL|nr:peptidoglycan glycosyltransferase /cell elongation-specific peptidoglycan D,D-transpeptidase [Paenibacillus typhae]